MRTKDIISVVMLYMSIPEDARDILIRNTKTLPYKSFAVYRLRGHTVLLWLVLLWLYHQFALNTARWRYNAVNFLTNIYKRHPYSSSVRDCKVWSLIARFMGPTWGSPGSCRPQVGPILAPGTLLSGVCLLWIQHLISIQPQFLRITGIELSRNIL